MEIAFPRSARHAARFGGALGCLMAFVLLAGCDSKPVDADGETAFREHAGQHWKGLIEVGSFIKTDGQASETNGVKVYRMDYEGELKILKPCTYGELNGTMFAKEGVGYTASDNPGSHSVYPGDVVKIRGYVLLQRSEAGWKLGDAKVQPVSVVAGPNRSSYPAEVEVHSDPVHNNIFTGTAGSSGSVSRPQPKEPSVTHREVSPPAPVIAPSPAPIPVPTGPTLEEAQEKLKTVKAAVERTVTQTAEYRAAKSVADKAAEEVEKARSNSGVGSPELLEAHRVLMEAKSKLNKMVEEAASRNPAYLTAKHDLETARQRARAK